MINAGIIGATGYAGVELVRLLLGHPEVNLTAISSVSFEGQKISDVYPSLYNVCDLECKDQTYVLQHSDVVFAALPHGLSEQMARTCIDAGKVFIDLGADFRLEDEEEYKTWYKGEYKDPELHEQAVYGLPELMRDKIKGKRLIANPGCYTTSVQLALAPAILDGLVEVEGIIADCKSGVTGSGRGLSQTTHFAELNEGFAPYKVATHRHTPEIEQTFSHLSGQKVKLLFVPHLLPINRGIIATCYAKIKGDVSFDTIRNTYRRAYEDEYFVRLLPEGRTADLKYVKYSNFCDISVHLDLRTNTLIAVSAIDNMVKGAAGQAIQNMNIVFGFDEKTGLTVVPPAF